MIDIENILHVIFSIYFYAFLELEHSSSVIFDLFMEETSSSFLNMIYDLKRL